MSIHFCNKRHGFSISCVVIHYLLSKKESELQATKHLFRTDLLGNILSSVYIKKQVCRSGGKIIKRNTRCRRLAEQILMSWRKQQHHCFRKRYMKEKKKAQNLWLMRITVSEVLMMAKNISMVQTKTCPLIYFQTKQKK